jgi:tetratricopeptide (TPR) repeat protein
LGTPLPNKTGHRLVELFGAALKGALQRSFVPEHSDLFVVDLDALDKQAEIGFPGAYIGMLKLTAHRRAEFLHALRCDHLTLQALLATARPDVHRADWATSLANLSVHLDGNGRPEEALKVAQQAAEIHRALAAARPDAHRADLGTSLGILATRLGENGHYEEALKVAQQAEEIFRALAAARPEIYRADWARSLGDLAKSLSDNGRGKDALKIAHQQQETSSLFTAAELRRKNRRPVQFG